MMKHDGKTKPGDKKITARKKQSVDVLQEIPAKELMPIYNEDTKSLPIALKEKITTALLGIADEKMLAFLSTSLNCEEIRQDAMRIIRKETTYIARIPKKLDAAMNRGLLDFMTDSKTGENLGVLVDSKHKSRGFVQIEKSIKPDIVENITNIAVQQQLMHMTEVINDVRSRVIALQESHDSDLFGSIKGMHQQLLQIKDTKNPDTRKQLTANAITVLNEVRGKVESAILNALKDIADVPDSDVSIIRKIIRDKNFLTNTVEQYNRIEELFSYYLTATQLLGYAYAFLDEPQSYEDIFSPSPELIDNPNLQKLLLAENLFEETIGETWYKNPEKYLREIKEQSHTLFLKSHDTIEIEITGKELLEAIEYGRTEDNTDSEEKISTNR